MHKRGTKKGQILKNPSFNKVQSTDKRTDVWTRDFIPWKINFGLWAVAWAELWNKRVSADYEQLFWVVFLIFHGQNFFFLILEFFSLEFFFHVLVLFL